MTLHVGLIGGGNISETHARAARAISGVEIAAVFGANAEKVHRLCREYGGKPYADPDLSAFLERAAELAEDTDPALSLLLSVLAEEPPEIAANWAPALDELEGKLRPDTDGPTLAEAASKALAQWQEN